MSRGKFITLEGGEGVGKSTSLKFIKHYLEEFGIPVFVTREPGGTPLAEKLRKILLSHGREIITEQSELLILFAARSQHIKNVILPELAKGNWVLCDRFTDSTYAYQGGAREMSLSAIEWLENFVHADLKPDLTLLFDAPVEIGMKRAMARGDLDRFEQESIAFFESVRRSFLVQAELNQDRIKIVKADHPLCEVQNQIIGILHPLIANDYQR